MLAIMITSPAFDTLGFSLTCLNGSADKARRQAHNKVHQLATRLSPKNFHMQAIEIERDTSKPTPSATQWIQSVIYAPSSFHIL